MVKLFKYFEERNPTSLPNWYTHTQTHRRERVCRSLALQRPIGLAAILLPAYWRFLMSDHSVSPTLFIIAIHSWAVGSEIPSVSSVNETNCRKRFSFCTKSCRSYKFPYSSLYWSLTPITTVCYFAWMFCQISLTNYICEKSIFSVGIFFMADWWNAFIKIIFDFWILILDVNSMLSQPSNNCVSSIRDQSRTYQSEHARFWGAKY